MFRNKIELLIVTIAVCLAIALIVPAVQKTRESAVRTQSINNLKQIAIASQSFHDGNKRLPFNGCDDAAGPMIFKAEAELNSTPNTGSWQFQILPYTISFMHLWPKVRELGLDFYLCPGRGRPGMEEGRGGWSDYFINNYLNDPTNAETPNNAPSKRDLVGIKDGASYTIFAGHGNISTNDYRKDRDVVGSSNIFLGGTFGTARAGPNWQECKPLQVALRRDSAEPPDFVAGGWGGPFSQGGLFCWCDGTVRMVTYGTPDHIFGAYLTPTGNEKVELPD